MNKTSDMNSVAKHAILLLLMVHVSLLGYVQSCHEEEAIQLLYFKSNITSAGKDDLSSWISGTDCCKTWNRVVCNSQTSHIENLIFDSLDIQATGNEFLAPLSNLPNLVNLKLSLNSLDIPSVLRRLGTFPSLKILDLSASFRNKGANIESSLQGWSSESLERVTYLDLSGNFLVGALPVELGRMLRLRHLDLSNNFFVSNFGVLSTLSQLEHLGMENINLSKGNLSRWSFPKLYYLSLRGCSLKLHHMNWMKINSDLEALYLDSNGLKDANFVSRFRNLRELSLAKNSLRRKILVHVSNLTNLRILDLGHNHLDGRFPEFVNLRRLTNLNLESNAFVGRIPESIGNLTSLTSLYLDRNNLSGTLPNSISKLVNLVAMRVSFNQLNESISPHLILPPSLQQFSIANNKMGGAISEELFANATKLDYLDLTQSGLSVNISPIWIPVFSLTKLGLGSCKMNKKIPMWLSTQNEIGYLDLSDCDLHGHIPSWFWEIASNSDVAYLNISYNQLQGTIQQLGNFCYADLSFNMFSGSLPSSKSCTEVYLYAKNNSFDSSVLYNGMESVVHLDASNNIISGPLLQSLVNSSSLELLNLANNSLHGEMPHEFGSHLPSLKTLNLYQNNLEGNLPKSLGSCSKLEVVNVGRNGFRGSFPSWISKLQSLRILEMTYNNFQGTIPKDIGTLPSLHFLDISSNEIHGNIPHSISNLSILTQLHLEDFSIQNNSASKEVGSLKEVGSSKWSLKFGVVVVEAIDFNVKGLYLHYTRIPSALTCIDLSNNSITGSIPQNIEKLKGLRLLNISRNNLTGSIPISMGSMSELEQLDLSYNNLSGRIPNEFASLSSLGYLNLVYNNLSGDIPRTGQMLTFGPSFFQGNPYLKDSIGSGIVPHLHPKERVKTEKGFGNGLLWKMAVGFCYGIGCGVFVFPMVFNRALRRNVCKVMDVIISKLVSCQF